MSFTNTFHWYWECLNPEFQGLFEPTVEISIILDLNVVLIPQKSICERNYSATFFSSSLLKGTVIRLELKENISYQFMEEQSEWFRKYWLNVVKSQNVLSYSWDHQRKITNEFSSQKIACRKLIFYTPLSIKGWEKRQLLSLQKI